LIFLISVSQVGSIGRQRGSEGGKEEGRKERRKGRRETRSAESSENRFIINNIYLP
jgi:hypothetical protein